MEVDSENSDLPSEEIFVEEEFDGIICGLEGIVPEGTEISPIFCFPSNQEYICCADVLSTNDSLQIFTGSTSDVFCKFACAEDVILTAEIKLADTVTSVELNVQKTTILVADLSGNVLIYDINNLDQFKWKIETGPLQWAEWFGEDNRRIICGLSDGGIQIWTIETSDYVEISDVRSDSDFHTPFVKYQHWDFDQDYNIAFGCFDGSLVLHNLGTNRRQHKFSFPLQSPIVLLRMSQNSNIIFVLHEKSSEIWVVNIRTFQKFCLKDPKHSLTQITNIFPTDQFIISVGNIVSADSVTAHVGIWDVSSRRILNQAKFEFGITFSEIVNQNAIVCSFDNGLIYIIEIPSLKVQKYSFIGETEQTFMKYFKNDKLLFISTDDAISNVFRLE